MFAVFVGKIFFLSFKIHYYTRYFFEETWNFHSGTNWAQKVAKCSNFGQVAQFFGFRQCINCTLYLAKAEMLISRLATAVQLVCAYAKILLYENIHVLGCIRTIEILLHFFFPIELIHIRFVFSLDKTFN